MRIVVIGLGSMGKRRARLIHEMYPEYVIYGVDGREDRRRETYLSLGFDCFESIEAIIQEIDCAFICTSPLSHSTIIAECLRRRWDVFTELNLTDDGYEENMQLAKDNNCCLFLSSTFFYRAEIQHIRSQIKEGMQWNYIYHIGQYLPDWHPWENYKDFFVQDKRTNGCREIMAIELPWLIGTFGDVVKSHTISDKMTNLKIGYDDNFMIQLIHTNGNKGLLVVDIVSPCAVRRFEAYTEGKHIFWGGTPDSLFEYSNETKSKNLISIGEETERVDGYAAFVVENAYKNEIKEFFDVILNNEPPMYGFEEDQRILRLIDSLGA